MPGNRLNCLQTLLKITCDQFVLIIHLGKNREVQHQLWEKHVNQEEGEPLEGVGGSWSVCCWRSSRMGQAVRNDPDREGPSVGRGRVVLISWGPFQLSGLLPAQTWTCILCCHLCLVCLPQSDLSPDSPVLLQECVCHLLANHWNTL